MNKPWLLDLDVTDDKNDKGGGVCRGVSDGVRLTSTVTAPCPSSASISGR